MSSRTKVAFLLILLSIQGVRSQNGWEGVYSPSICAVKGSTVEMECTYKYPPPATKVLQTLWYRHGQDNGLESLESFREYVGRARHHCSGQRCSLSITDVTQEDTRTFRFRFITDIAYGKYTVPFGVTLFVTELRVKKPTRQTSAACESSCSSPAVAYVWYENGVKVGSETGIHYSGNFKSSFSYSCAVKGNEEHPSPAVCVDDTHCNKVTYRGSKRVCAPSGSSVNLSCSYSHTGALTSQFWFSPHLSQHWRDPSVPEDICQDARYSSLEAYRDITEPVSALTITDLRESDSLQFQYKFTTSELDWRSTLPGISLTVTDLQVQVRAVLDVSSNRVELVCRSRCRYPSQHWYIWFKNGVQVAWKQWGYETYLEPGDFVSCGLEGHDGHLSAPLYSPSGPSVVLSPPGAVMEGSPANLTCSFGPTKGFNYTWEKDLSPWQFVGKDPVLSPARSSDSGRYSCSVDSEFGRRTSAPVFIDVEYAPRPPSVWVTSGEVKEGDSVELNCSSDANPEANYTWYKEGDTVASGNKFTITGIRREQAGGYLCRAWNLRGHNETVVQLVVVSATSIESNNGLIEGPMKIPFVSITGLLFLLLSLVVFHLLRRFKSTKQPPEPAWRAEYHVKRESIRKRDDTAVEEDDHDYVSVGSWEDPDDSPAL